MGIGAVYYVHIILMFYNHITAGLYALENLIKWQKVEYDFSYSHHDFPANMRILVLSEGKSLLPVSYMSLDSKGVPQ